MSYPQEPQRYQQHPQNYTPQQHYPQHYSQPAPKKRRVWPWVLVGALAVIVLGFVGCSAVLGAGAVAVDNAIKDAEAPVTYRYQVEGRGTATVTYQTDSGMSQAGDVMLPFERDETFTGVMDFVHITATLGMNGGQITCRVLDPSGKVLAENTASGQFASCSASPQPEPVKR